MLTIIHSLANHDIGSDFMKEMPSNKDWTVDADNHGGFGYGVQRRHVSLRNIFY